MSEKSPWLYQTLLGGSGSPMRLSEKPMYLNANSLKSLFQMDRPGYQQNNPTRRRKRLHNVEALTKKSVNQEDRTTTTRTTRKVASKKPKHTNEVAVHRSNQDKAPHVADGSAVAAQLGLTADEYAALEASFQHSGALDQRELTERYRQVFDEFDQDKSGSISPDELRAMMKALGEEDLDDADIDEIIEQADSDKSGTIEFNEFVEMMKARKRLLAVVQHIGKTGAIPIKSTESSVTNNSPLPPLKMSTMQSKKHLKQYNRFFSRPTPNCLRPGVHVDMTSLRRELALSEYGLKELDLKVKEDVLWVQANVPVTSLKAQLFAQKWGAEKMNALFSRILLNFQARAFFKWVDYLAFLNAKLKADRYLKCKAGARVTSLMANWKMKALAKAWVSWSSECAEQARNEQQSSAIEIQRLVRGFLSRTAVWRRAQYRGAVQFQRVVRGFLARRRVARRRRAMLEQACATLLQRAFRGYAGRKLGRILFQSQAETRAAKCIQRAFRAYEQKLFARAVAQTTRQHEAATTIQSAGRRMVATREANRRRLAKRKDAATRLLQRVGRGMLARRRCASKRQQ
ncbi:hypothetical protein As57867_017995, partial [Aphanomyces stellatus]